MTDRDDQSLDVLLSKLTIDRWIQMGYTIDQFVQGRRAGALRDMYHDAMHGRDDDDDNDDDDEHEEGTHSGETTSTEASSDSHRRRSTANTTQSFCFPSARGTTTTGTSAGSRKAMHPLSTTTETRQTPFLSLASTSDVGRSGPSASSASDSVDADFLSSAQQKQPRYAIHPDSCMKSPAPKRACFIPTKSFGSRTASTRSEGVGDVGGGNATASMPCSSSTSLSASRLTEITAPFAAPLWDSSDIGSAENSTRERYVNDDGDENDGSRDEDDSSDDDDDDNSHESILNDHNDRRRMTSDQFSRLSASSFSSLASLPASVSVASSVIPGQDDEDTEAECTYDQHHQHQPNDSGGDDDDDNDDYDEEGDGEDDSRGDVKRNSSRQTGKKSTIAGHAQNRAGRLDMPSPPFTMHLGSDVAWNVGVIREIIDGKANSATLSTTLNMK